MTSTPEGPGPESAGRPSPQTNLREENLRLRRRADSLTASLRAARDQLLDLKAQVAAFTTPPLTYGHLLEAHDDGTADVQAGGRRMRVSVLPEVGLRDLRPGRRVRLDETMTLVGVDEWEDTGEVVTVHETLPDGRVVVVLRGEDQRVARRAEPLRDARLRQGDAVLLDPRSGLLLQQIPRAQVAELVLEEVPDISYDDIGGLSGQIEAIRDSIELPYLHPELFREHHLRPPKGVLLYGPPGCGKTLIAKAVAASLARQSTARRADAAGEGDAGPSSYFLNVKGPELLDKYVGETERAIRAIFARARDHAHAGAPVVVFFDEMDSLFRTRGSGRSSDVETTIVPQLLAEIDGVERLDNVIVIGATNREDMIDPAILRPGRLDAKIRIDRPDADAAREIFAKYLTPDLPLHPDELAAHGGSREATVAALIDQVVERMYARTPENRFLEVTYASGAHETWFFADFASGAMIQNVVDRAKRLAIKDLLRGGEGHRGLRAGHLIRACEAEFAENEDLPDTSNPDEWARISGRRGERVVDLRLVRPAQA